MLRTLILIAATLIASDALASLNVSMRIEPETTLPGVPVSFSFAITNPSASPVTIRGAVNLEITAVDESTYFATWDTGYTSTPFPTELADRLTIPPGVTRELYLPLDRTLAAPEFFNDPRLNRPGRFVLRAHVYAVRADGGSEDLPSNQVSLEVRTPEGDDLSVWRLLTAATHSGEAPWTAANWASSGTALAAQILSRYPNSAYAPYATLVHATRTRQERLDAIDRALAQRPAGPVADMLLAVKGWVHIGLSNDAFADADLDLAEAEARAAQDTLRGLIRMTPYAFVRDEAVRALKEVKEPAHIRGMFDAIHANDPPAPLQVIPHVDCVEHFGSTIVARFGYTNPNRVGKWIQPGSGNRLIPDDGVGAQPGYFMPGRHDEVGSTIAAKGKQPVWRLDGSEAAATSQTPTCAGDRATVRPVIECVRHDSEGVVVSFGYDNPNAFAVVVPVGNNNHFDGQSRSVGQPEVFLAGRQKNVFKTKVKDSLLTWQLDGGSVTASPRTPLPCPVR